MIQDLLSKLLSNHMNLDNSHSKRVETGKPGIPESILACGK